MFSHFLVTRFNIRVEQYGPEKMNSPQMDQAWLEGRLQLFLDYCAPSVLNQSAKNFKWLIYFDPATPEKIMKQIEFLRTAAVPVEFVFVKDFATMIGDLKEKIINAPAPYIITSRIDNDDMISCDFIRDVQKLAEANHRMVINFCTGYEYSLREHVLKKWTRRFTTQFTSLIEDGKSSDVLSIYGFPHWRLPGDSYVKNIVGKPYWLHLRHELNYSPDVRGGIPCFIHPGFLNLFPTKVRSLPLSWINTMKYAIKWFPQMIKRRLGIKV